MTTKKRICVVVLAVLACAGLSQFRTTVGAFVIMKLLTTGFIGYLLLFKCPGKFGLPGGMLMGIVSAATCFTFYFCLGLMSVAIGQVMYKFQATDPFAIAFCNLFKDTWDSTLSLGVFFESGDTSRLDAYLQLTSDDCLKPFLATIVTFILIGFSIRGLRGSRSQRTAPH
jgi:hypothetical protein